MSAELDRRAFLGRAARFAAAGVAGHTLLGGATSVLSDGMLGSRHGVLGQGRAPAITLPGIRPLATRTPAIIPRAAWGADESRRRSRTVYHPVRKVVVHHTVTPNGDPDPVTQIRKIYDMHLARDGGRWSDIGYHYLIDQQGRIYEGRWARDYDRDEARTGEDPFGRLVQGSHAGEWNPGTLGIALMGNFVDGDPTPQALESLIDLIVWKCGVHGLSPDGQEPHLDDRGRLGTFPTIIGHSDVRVTECPGPRLKALIPRIRTQVARRLARSEDDGPAGGYWVLDQEGGVFAYGDAHFRGSLPALRAAGTSAGRGAAIAAGIRRDGYLVLDRDGGVFAFGKAKYHGSIPSLREKHPE
ncbi:MAG TPA: N-acetylmuramoyl-L-alanine amidase, partial [Acidimicrobiia bacterium]|nr:N-acetylmuramoyl-L-alanine amidase [Acidimicrobiia bacterium]